MFTQYNIFVFYIWENDKQIISEIVLSSLYCGQELNEEKDEL